jgi:hypothetical protein
MTQSEVNARSTSRRPRTYVARMAGRDAASWEREHVHAVARPDVDHPIGHGR